MWNGQRCFVHSGSCGYVSPLPKRAQQSCTLWFFLQGIPLHPYDGVTSHFIVVFSHLLWFSTKTFFSHTWSCLQKQSYSDPDNNHILSFDPCATMNITVVLSRACLSQDSSLTLQQRLIIATDLNGWFYIIILFSVTNALVWLHMKSISMLQWGVKPISANRSCFPADDVFTTSYSLKKLNRSYDHVVAIFAEKLPI